MPNPDRETFTIEVESEMLRRLRDLALREGRPVEALVEEALVDLIERRQSTSRRAEILGVYWESHEKFGTLYRKLAD